MPWLLPVAFIIALVVMIYAAILAFRGEVWRPLSYLGIAGGLVWLAWELRMPL